MPNRLSSTSKYLLLALGICSFPLPAFAGFEWVPPSETSVAPAPAPMNAPSVQTWPLEPAHARPATSDVVSPVIIEGHAPTPKPLSSSQDSSTVISTAPISAAPTPLPSPAPVMPSRQNQMTMHPLLPPSSATTTTTTTVTTTSTPSTEPVVRGFAKQVPLAVALRQILPSGYGFSVDPDVDLGVLISFQGGKPWRQTLSDALEPAGLVVHERNQMVSIVKAGSIAMEPAPPPVTVATVPPAATPHLLEPPMQPVAPVAGNVVSQAESAAPVSEVWQANRGDSLHKVLEAWSHHAGIELNWMAEYDYPIQASFNYSGYYQDAVRALLTGFEEAHPQPVAELHENSSLGQRVLVVQARGNNYSD